MDIVINPVATSPRIFTWPPAPWPGSKTNIWIDVYWSLDIPGNYRWQRTNDGITWVEHGTPFTVGVGQTFSVTDSVDQFPANGQPLTWKRIVKTDSPAASKKK